MNKKELRTTFKLLRHSLTDGQRNDYDAQIRKALIPELYGLKHVALFLPIAKFHEIDLSGLLHFSEFTWYAPKAFFEERRLEFVEIKAGIKFTISKYGIPEPDGDFYADPKTLDAVILPMLVSDEKGYRLGYGQGFYDQFLKRCRIDCKRIGVSYFQPIEKITDVEMHDEPIHICISPDIL
jgi:5-formyltetrahydrofolate cyclo-ligase